MTGSQIKAYLQFLRVEDEVEGERLDEHGAHHSVQGQAQEEREEVADARSRLIQRLKHQSDRPKLA